MEKEFILSKIKETEKKFNIKILYCYYDGSILYGTNNENSDIDVNFIYISDIKDILLKKDLPFIDVIKNETKEKNTKHDIDMKGISLNEFLNSLTSMNTNSVDMLFSMFYKENIILEDTEFTDYFKTNYLKFLNRDMKKFINYSLAQVTKFGIKGQRYSELDSFYRELENLVLNNENISLKDSIWNELKELIQLKEYSYIKFTYAPGAIGIDGDIEYISILGKMFHSDIKCNYLKTKVFKLYNSFGNRTKTIAKTKTKTDFKALSHSYRIAKETMELISTGFIKFPLTYSNKLKEIKYISENNVSNEYVEEIIKDIELMFSKIDKLSEKSVISKNLDIDFIEKTILYFHLKEY